MVNFSLEEKSAGNRCIPTDFGTSRDRIAYAQAGERTTSSRSLSAQGTLPLTEELGIKGRNGPTVCDVTDEEQVNALVEKIEKEVGVIDILVNNAGIIKRIPMLRDVRSELKLRQVIDVDLKCCCSLFPRQ